MVREQRQVKSQALVSDGWSWEGRDQREGVPSSQQKLHHPAWSLNRPERDRAQLRERTSAEEISTCWRQSAVWVQSHELPLLRQPSTSIRGLSLQNTRLTMSRISYTALCLFWMFIYLAASDLSCGKQGPPCVMQDLSLQLIDSLVEVLGLNSCGAWA